MCPSSMWWTGPSHLRRRWLRRECMLGKPARDSISLLGMWYCHLMPKMCRSIAGGKSSSGVPVWCRWSKFTAVEQLAENACLVDVHLGVFSQKFVFQALLVHLDMVPVALPILREISESRLKFMRTVEPTRWIRRLHRECRRRFWLQGLGWHLGHSHWFSWGWLWGQSFRAGEFVEKPLHCFLGECYQGSIVSKEHVTHKNSFDFGPGAEAS